MIDIDLKTDDRPGQLAQRGHLSGLKSLVSLIWMNPRVCVWGFVYGGWPLFHLWRQPKEKTDKFKSATMIFLLEV